MKRPAHDFCFLIALFLIGIVPAHAQQQKIGYVNTDLILNEIPEYQGVQQQLLVVSQQWRDQLQQMQQEIDELKDDFEAKEILYTDEIKNEKLSQIEKKQQAREQFMEQKFGAEGDYFKKQQELLEPIQRNIYEAITSVSNRGGFDFIFDRAKNSSLLFGRKQWNLNEDVLQELGISLNN